MVAVFTGQSGDKRQRHKACGGKGLNSSLLRPTTGLISQTSTGSKTTHVLSSPGSCPTQVLTQAPAMQGRRARLCAVKVKCVRYLQRSKAGLHQSMVQGQVQSSFCSAHEVGCYGSASAKANDLAIKRGTEAETIIEPCPLPGTPAGGCRLHSALSL